MKNGYQIYNKTSASGEARGLLEKVGQHYGFVPNALGAMVEAPQAVEGYLQLDALAHQTSFNAVERNVVWLTLAREYECSYCVAAHTAFAMQDGTAQEIIQSLREDRPLHNPALEALRVFTRRMVQSGCNPSDEDLQAFMNYGYGRRQVLEIVLMLANKLIAIFSNRIMGTDLDEALQPTRWEKTA